MYLPFRCPCYFFSLKITGKYPPFRKRKIFRQGNSGWSLVHLFFSFLLSSLSQLHPCLFITKFSERIMLTPTILNSPPINSSYWFLLSMEYLRPFTNF